MKYSGATINSSSANNNNNNNIGGRPGPEAIRAANSPRPSEDLSTAPSETYLSSRSSQQRLFTIEGKFWSCICSCGWVALRKW